MIPCIHSKRSNEREARLQCLPHPSKSGPPECYNGIAVAKRASNTCSISSRVQRARAEEKGKTAGPQEKRKWSERSSFKWAPAAAEDLQTPGPLRRVTSAAIFILSLLLLDLLPPPPPPTSPSSFCLLYMHNNVLLFSLEWGYRSDPRSFFFFSFFLSFLPSFLFFRIFELTNRDTRLHLRLSVFFLCPHLEWYRRRFGDYWEVDDDFIKFYSAFLITRL